MEASEAKLDEMSDVLAGVLALMQATSVATPVNQQESVVLESALTKLPNDTKEEQMTTPTQNKGVDRISLNNTTMGIAKTSPVDHSAVGGLLESNHGTDDTQDDLISHEQLKFTKAIPKAMYIELAPFIVNRDQIAIRPTVYRGSKNRTIDEWLLVMKRYTERVYMNSSTVDKAWAIIDHLGD